MQTECMHGGTDSLSRAGCEQVTSSGVVPDGCPMGLPINCFAPQVAIVENSLWMTGGECDPAVIGGKAYWHYPEVTFFGNLTLISGRGEAASSSTRAKSDDTGTCEKCA